MKKANRKNVIIDANPANPTKYSIGLILLNLLSIVFESTADGIFREVAEGLAETQKEKLGSLSEGVEFESENAYREKLVTLRESYFPSETKSSTNKVETLSEGVTAEGAGSATSDSMSNYLKALGMAK